MKPDLLDWPRWKVYTSLAFVPFFCAILVGMKWLRHHDEGHFNDLYFYLTLLCFGVGVIAVRLASCVRYLDRQQDELLKQIAFDTVRISQREEQVGELKDASKPTH